MAKPNPELGYQIDLAYLAADKALGKVGAEQAKAGFNRWVGVGNDEVFSSVMEKLGIQIGASLRVTEADGRKSEWVATTNPNLIVLSEYRALGEDWSMTERSMGIVSNKWLEEEGLLGA